MEQLNVSLRNRFMSHVVPVTECGCWLWMANTNRKGYGAFKVNGKMVAAHRFSWTLHKGEIPVELCVLHKCDVRNCVNPDHLFLGTNQDNVDDMWAKGRATKVRNPNGKWVNGVTHHAAKINMEIAEQIRALYPALSYKKLAAKFGIDSTTVFRTVKGLYWKAE